MTKLNDITKAAAGDPQQMDFWTGPEALPITGHDVSSRMVSQFDPGDEPKGGGAGTLLLAVFILAMVGGVGYVYLNPETIDQVMLMISGDDMATTPTDMAEDAFSEDELAGLEEEIDTLADSEEIEALSGPQAPANPYWQLPNWLEGKKKSMNGAMTKEQEEMFRRGLASRYTWQRYKTILIIRNMRLSGSEKFLFDSLTEKKLWARMRAAMALADFGQEVSYEAVETIMQNEDQRLLRDFFKRFIPRSRAGERYILRQAVRGVGDEARLVILKTQKRALPPLKDLYFVAAQYDPSPKVRSWANANMPYIPPRIKEGLQEVVFGTATWQQFMEKYRSEVGRSVALNPSL